MSRRPVIGISCDLVEVDRGEVGGGSVAPQGRLRYQSPAGYARAVEQAGGAPVLLPCEAGAVERYVRLCDGFLLTGGDDPATEPFGEPTHPQARPLHPARQRFELALLALLDERRAPVLGVCLGMQLMALHHGGALHQYLPEAPTIGAEQAAAHADGVHDVRRNVDAHPVLPEAGRVPSHHRQAVAETGAMRAVAVSDDEAGGLIEAVDLGDADERFYLGVQWHPERTDDARMGRALIGKFIEACGDMDRRA